MAQFELNRLLTYDQASILAEIRRVAALVPAGRLTRKKFDRYSKVSSSTVVRHLGPWEASLERAGLKDRYAGRTVSAKMRHQAIKKMTEAELLDELRRVAQVLGLRRGLTMQAFSGQASVSAEGVKRRFGSWRVALERAGLEPSNLGRRYSDAEYFENLLKVWTNYGRQPTYTEMSAPPSTIKAKAYEAKWGTWRKALLAFIGAAESGVEQPVHASPQTISDQNLGSTSTPQARRPIPLSVRYRVLRRDSFRCVLCGTSPALQPGCALHVDHIQPVAAGGTTLESNLRTVCAVCNLGKGASWNEEHAV